MKKIEKFLKIIKKGDNWLFFAMLFMFGVLPVSLLLLGGFSSTATAIVIVVIMSIFIGIILKISFNNVKENKYTYDTSNANKLNEYEKIYMEFYEKYKYFFDRNTENENKKEKISLNKVLKAIGVLLVFVGFAMGGMVENAESYLSTILLFSSLMSLIVGFIILVYVEFRDSKNQPVFIRDQAIQDLLKLINNTFICSDEKQENVKQQYYKVASLVGENIANYYSENHIYGYLGDKKEIYMEMAEVISTGKIMYLEDDKKETYMEMVDVISAQKDSYLKEDELIFFKGVFVAVDINKKIYNTITVTPNTYFDKMYNVKMDNTGFERYFDIKCEDKVLVMRIFTAEVIDKLYDLHNKCKIQYEIIVDNNKIYLRFDFYPLLDINEWTLSKDNIKYNCERVMYMIEIAKMIAQAINELEI